VLQKILIANRGEIAVRVMRTCREMGITTVAVYSDVDRDALHVRFADEAYALGGQTAAESYLNQDKIIEVIRRSGADGVHPGYGFYSENADFARAITAMGVAWIGPPPAAIEDMGDKISARKAAARGDVASVPGTTDPVTGPEDVIAFGEQYGWPVAIKAAYGGGGRGMKVVESAEEAAAALESAQREALAYFGRDEAYLEKYLTHPRHIEIQVFADQHGNAVYLGDRDCSVQRRHQKLIEEAPAGDLPAEIRRAMGEAAVKVAKATGYVNAGTVEMLYQDGEFFFLEMNTRLQVEHCVTEMVTQLDLVREQIRVASGEALSIAQDEVTLTGHSIECRINAENAAKGFLPSPGPINALHLPAGPGVRWDGGYEPGDEVSQYYDNLVGKLIVWAPDREQARVRMLRALDEFAIDGVHTTIPAQRVVLEHPDFAGNTHSTRWLETQVDLSGITSSAGDTTAPEGDDLVAREVPVEVDGRRFGVKVWLPDAPVATVPSGRKSAKPRPAGGSTGGGGGDGTITAPMQGTIVKVLVEAGQTVAEGDSLLVLEAMKMENSINAERAGTVKEIKVEPGQTVSAGDTLLTIE
jgi:acetyl-CoA/propionyl-CoA carboxylase biotin carboxyl carrier protein